MTKMDKRSVPLGGLTSHVFQGLITSADKVYILEKRGELPGGLVRMHSKELGREVELETTILKPLLKGTNVSRYYSPLPKEFLLFPYDLSERHATLIPEIGFQRQYPRAWEYLLLNKENLEARESGKFKRPGWYALGRNQNLAIHDQRKLAIPSTVRRLVACYDESGSMYLDNVRVNGIIAKDTSDRNYKYLCGLLNSNALHWYFSHLATPFANGWYGANRQFIVPLPIHTLDLAKPGETRQYDSIVGLVEEMLALQERLAPLRSTPSEARAELERRVTDVDLAIDDAVYALYGLTDAERRLVEGE